jgi:hypothetical protein
MLGKRLERFFLFAEASRPACTESNSPGAKTSWTWHETYYSAPCIRKMETTRNCAPYVFMALDVTKDNENLFPYLEPITKDIFWIMLCSPNWLSLETWRRENERRKRAYQADGLAWYVCIRTSKYLRVWTMLTSFGGQENVRLCLVRYFVNFLYERNPKLQRIVTCRAWSASSNIYKLSSILLSLL